MDKKPEHTSGEENTAKYFDEEKYITAIVSPDGTVKKTSKEEAALEELISLLSSVNHEHKDAALELLRTENDAKTMLEAISQTENKKHKAALIAACWESGIDLTGCEVFFAPLALDTDLFVSLEAITVLDSIDTMEVEVTKEILKKLNTNTIANHPNAPMLDDLKLSLEEKISQSN